jgi:hypothetical protein
MKEQYGFSNEFRRGVTFLFYLFLNMKKLYYISIISLLFRIGSISIVMF